MYKNNNLSPSIHINFFLQQLLKNMIFYCWFLMLINENCAQEKWKNKDFINNKNDLFIYYTCYI